MQFLAERMSSVDAQDLNFLRMNVSQIVSKTRTIASQSRGDRNVGDLAARTIELGEAVEKIVKHLEEQLNPTVP
jgi:hypothetical protein